MVAGRQAGEGRAKEADSREIGLLGWGGVSGCDEVGSEGGSGEKERDSET